MLNSKVEEHLNDYEPRPQIVRMTPRNLMARNIVDAFHMTRPKTNNYSRYGNGGAYRKLMKEFVV